MDLCNISTIKQLMHDFNISFRKEYGQNFLINSNIPERIAEACCELPDSVILEIGPGIGCLTQELAKNYKKVIALEIDRGLLPVLGHTLSVYSNVTVINEDIMKADIPALLKAGAEGAPISVCANLPYYITTPILMKLLESRIGFDFITIMVQSEVAARLCADAGNKDYGAITAVLNYYGTAEKLFNVSAGNFLPAPKVDSAVIRIKLHKSPPFKLHSEAMFFAIIKAAFGQRRKTLSNAISGIIPRPKTEITDIIASLGHRPDIRGERLSSADFATLANVLSNAPSPL